MRVPCSALHPQAPLPPAVSAALSRCRATVASYLFWPELPEHELLLPPDLQTALEVSSSLNLTVLWCRVVRCVHAYGYH